MPVRSLNSAVFKWPDREIVDAAFRKWAGTVADSDASILAIGYFGSYATGDWGVGSDLDGIVIRESCSKPFERRSVDFDTSSIPVSVDLLVYASAEWAHMQSTPSRFSRTLAEITVWVYRRDRP